MVKKIKYTILIKLSITSIFLVIVTLLCMFDSLSANNNLQNELFINHGKNIKTITFDFKEVRSFSSLSHPLVSYGKCWVNKSTKNFRWEIGAQPLFPSMIVIGNGNEYLIYHIDVPLRSMTVGTRISSDLLLKIFDFFNFHRMHTLADKYKNQFFGKIEKQNMIQEHNLSSQLGKLSSHIAEVIVYLQLNDPNRMQLKIKTKSGLLINYYITNIKLNTPINPSIFSKPLLSQ